MFADAATAEGGVGIDAAFGHREAHAQGQHRSNAGALLSWTAHTGGSAPVGTPVADVMVRFGGPVYQ